MDEWLEDAWTSGKGFCMPAEELAMVEEVAGENAGTYGEIMPDEFREVANWMGLGPSDVFMDMGSGVGKTVAQAWLEYGVQESIGIELVPSRHTLAKKSLWYLSDNLKTLYPQRGMVPGCVDEEGIRECCFMPKHDSSRDWSSQLTGTRSRVEEPQCAKLVQGDMLEQDVRKVTAIWISSLCMSSELLTSLIAKLEVEAPNLRAIASIKRLPGGLEKFEEQLPLHLPMSWTADIDDNNFPKDVTVHVYSRS